MGLTIFKSDESRDSPFQKPSENPGHTFESRRDMYLVRMYPLLHVVTYMTRIDYNALLTPLIAKAFVVQWIECRTSDSGATASADTFFLFIEKFTEYIQTFIYILARLSLCVICIESGKYMHIRF